MNQLELMQRANAALIMSNTGGDLFEHYDPEDGAYIPREYGFVENLICGVIETCCRDQPTHEEAAENARKWLTNMAQEMLTVADHL